MKTGALVLALVGGVIAAGTAASAVAPQKAKAPAAVGLYYTWSLTIRGGSSL